MRIWMFLSLLVLGACSKDLKVADNLIYSGECKVAIEANYGDAAIYVDEVKVGKGKIAIGIPCGEKSIRVEKAHYTPYEEYKVVSTDKPISLMVELEKQHVGEPYALSDQLIADVMTKDDLVPKLEVAKAGADDVEDDQELDTNFDIWNVKDWL